MGVFSGYVLISVVMWKVEMWCVNLVFVVVGFVVVEGYVVIGVEFDIDVVFWVVDEFDYFGVGEEDWVVVVECMDVGGVVIVINLVVCEGGVDVGVVYGVFFGYVGGNVGLVSLSDGVEGGVVDLVLVDCVCEVVDEYG